MFLGLKTKIKGVDKTIIKLWYKATPLLFSQNMCSCSKIEIIVIIIITKSNNNNHIKNIKLKITAGHIAFWCYEMIIIDNVAVVRVNIVMALFGFIKLNLIQLASSWLGNKFTKETSHIDWKNCDAKEKTVLCSNVKSS